MSLIFTKIRFIFIQKILYKFTFYIYFFNKIKTLNKTFKRFIFIQKQTNFLKQTKMKNSNKEAVSSTANLEAIKAILNKELVIVKGNTYCTYEPTKEPEIQEGLSILLEKYHLNPITIALGKFWNDRTTWKEVKDILQKIAEDNNTSMQVYIEQELLPELKVLESVQSAISRLRYNFNYMKPRENAADKSIQIKVQGTIYSIGKNKLAALKAEYSEKSELIAKILEVATPFESKIEEL